MGAEYALLIYSLRDSLLLLLELRFSHGRDKKIRTNSEASGKVETVSIIAAARNSFRDRAAR